MGQPQQNRRQDEHHKFRQGKHEHNVWNTKVTILQDGPRFLGKFDQDAVAEVLAASRKIGIDARAERRLAFVAGGRPAG